MKSAQVLEILNDRFDIKGAADDISKIIAAQNVRILRVRELPEKRFIDMGNGTVLDTWNNEYVITLPHTDLPKHFREGMPWEEAGAACAELQFAGHTGWSRPSPVSAYSLVKNNPTGSQIDTSIFKDTKEAGYWTNEKVAWDERNVRVVYYGCGAVYYGVKGGRCYVRPVRPASV